MKRASAAILFLLATALPGSAAIHPEPAAPETRLLVCLAPSPLTARVQSGRFTGATERELVASLAVASARPLCPDDEAYRARLDRVRPLLGDALPPESTVARRARLARFGLDRWVVITLPPGEDAGTALGRLGRNALVERAERDFRGRAARDSRHALRANRPAHRMPAERRSLCAETVPAGFFRYLPDDPLFGEQWYLDQASDADIDMPEAWETARSALDVPMAVLDSGVDTDHPDLRDAILPGYDYVNSDDDPEDDTWHGTHVTGLIAAAAGNGIGIAGAAAAVKVVPLKVLDADLWGFYSDWAAALRYAADLGVRVVNLSAGGSAPSAVLAAATAYAADRGVVICVAMMNSGDDTVYYPAADTTTIAVGATDILDRRAAPFSWSGTSGSCYGPHIDLVAPGDSLLSTVPGGYAVGGGTSQATPLVSAAAALILHLDSSLSPAGVRTLLRDSADDGVGRTTEDTAGFDIYHGAGRLNAASALAAAAGGSSPGETFTAGPPRPNPSRGITAIPFSLPEAATVTLAIYDVRGRLIARPLARAAFPAGEHTAVWYGADRSGRTAPSGLYLWELTAGNRRATGKLIRIR